MNGQGHAGTNRKLRAAGLAIGDLITSINGQAAVSTNQIVELMLTKRPGDKVTIEFTRNGASRSVAITLTTQPSLLNAFCSQCC